MRLKYFAEHRSNAQAVYCKSNFGKFYFPGVRAVAKWRLFGTDINAFERRVDVFERRAHRAALKRVRPRVSIYLC